MLLRCVGLTKSFGGVRAVESVDLEIVGGRVLALMGENGAGKSTVISLLSGALTPEAGTIFLDGHPLAGLTPRRARARGIMAIRQEPSLVSELSVRENLLLGSEPRRWGVVDRRVARATAHEWMTLVSKNISIDRPVGELSPADRQLVEVARCVGHGARVLFLDEPTASLGPAETDNLFGIVRDLTAEGVGVVYVSHRLDEVLLLADDVVVLRDGQLVDSGPRSGYDERSLVAQMAGRELAGGRPRAVARKPGDVRLRLDHVSTGGLRDVSLELRAGQVHGIAGIVGSGRSSLARVSAGAVKPVAGRMELDGQPYSPSDPRTALARGVAYVPEDRLRDGLFGELDQATNVTAALRAHDLPTRVVTAGRDQADADPILEQLDVVPRARRMPARSLSGGNQQKLVIGRALLVQPTVLILDEPTRGVDVGAKSDIHRLVDELTARGVAVALVSSDMRELLEVSDEITVLARGRVVARFEPPFEHHAVLAAATGGSATSSRAALARPDTNQEPA